LAGQNHGKINPPMNAMKMLLVLSLSVAVIFAWLWRRDRQQMNASRNDRAVEKSEPVAVVLDSSQAGGALGGTESPPKLRVPDGIKATVAGEENALPLRTIPFLRFIEQPEPLQPGKNRLRQILFDASSEFNDTGTKFDSDWQAPPRLNLQPGRSTPFSKPDWGDYPPLNHPIDR
jgi:hypothetical protein